MAIKNIENIFKEDACTCPWNQNPLEPKRGHHRFCRSLKRRHASDHSCCPGVDIMYGHMEED